MDQLRNDVRAMFKQFAGESLQFSQLDEFLDACGFQKQPGFKIRELAEKYDRDKSGTIDLEEFMTLFDDLDLTAKYGATLKEIVKDNKNVFTLQTSSKSAEGTKHTTTDDEIISMSQYVNCICEGDPHIQDLLPIKSNSTDLFSKVNNGLLLCKMVNKAVPGTIDERAINLKPTSIFQKQENHTLMLNSVAAIGITTINMDSQMLLNGVPHLILSLVWQIVKKSLLSKVNLKDNPYLSCLLRDGETMQELMALHPEEILIRWLNYQLSQAGEPMTVGNLSSDMKNSEVYARLLKIVAPQNKVTHEPSEILGTSDMTKRATLVLKNAADMNIPKFIVPNGITSGNTKLNLAFVASIFNTYPNLEPVEVVIPVIEETREEKMYRNWMNSLGVNPFVYHLYNDLNNGMILLHLMNHIKPGHVPSDKLELVANKINMPMKIMEKCNLVIEYAQTLGINTTTCSGANIRNAIDNKELMLGIIWQLMRAYTVSVLVNLSGSGKKMEDKTIVQWANSMVGSQYHIGFFGDSKIRNSAPIAELLLAITPNCLDKTLLKSTNSDEDLLKNAQYVVSIARKIGAKVYALPEDIVDLKSKMIMTIYAVLMTKHMQSRQ